MPALRDAADSVRSTVSTVTTRVAEVLSTVAVVIALVGWSLFWANLVRLHYVQGDLSAGVFTAVVCVVPGITVLVWYLVELLRFDIPSPDIAPDIAGN